MATYNVGNTNRRIVVVISNGTDTINIRANKVAFKGITVTNEKVWSTDTGRSTTALMMGKIVAFKLTFSIQLVGLTATEHTNIERVVSDGASPFFSATVNDGVKTYSNVTVYAASTSETVYNDNVAMYFDYKLELVER